MSKDLIIGAAFFLLIALGYYYFTHTAEEIIMHIVLIILTIGVTVVGLDWLKTLFEEIANAGSRAIRNFFNPTTLITESATQNIAREFTDQPRIDRDSTAKASTKPSTSENETINVSESKQFEIVAEVTKFLTANTKEGKLWLNITSNVNTYLLQISNICNVPKIVIVETIKRYPNEFRIYTNDKGEQYAYSVTAYEEKLRATQEKKNSTGVVFESTSPSINSPQDQPNEIQKETVYA